MPRTSSAAVLEALPLAAAAFKLRQERSAKPDIVEFSRRAGIEPDPWQQEVLRSTATNILLNCGRQVGKSTTVGTLVMYTATYDPGSLILLISPSQRQSQELFRMVLHVYRSTGRTAPAEAENKLNLELQNGSRVVALPGNEATIRGFPKVKLLVVDEASRVDDDLYQSVRPMLATSRGRLVAPSTPFGKRGWWYEAWRSPEDWHRVSVTSWQCPRIARDYLETERRRMGPIWFSQEFECAFIDAATSVFPHESIEAAGSADVVPFRERFGVAS